MRGGGRGGYWGRGEGRDDEQHIEEETVIIIVAIQVQVMNPTTPEI